MAGAVLSRIIAGTHGGRRLVTPAGQQTRPTTDRVREALFSAIESWAGESSADVGALAGLAFLDLYAGSGAVGLEAASRGAGPVLLVEAARRVVDGSTRRNVDALGLSAQVRTTRVEVLVGTPADRGYDVVFADPPYELETTAMDRLVADLLRHGWLAADGLLVVERSTRTPEPTWPRELEIWSRRYGETQLWFGARQPAR